MGRAGAGKALNVDRRLANLRSCDLAAVAKALGARRSGAVRALVANIPAKLGQYLGCTPPYARIRLHHTASDEVESKCGSLVLPMINLRWISL